MESFGVLRLEEHSTAKIATLTSTRISLELNTGRANYTVLDTQAFTTIDTPNLSVHPLREGTYRIQANSGSETEVVVRDGEAEVTTLQGTELVKDAQSITVVGSDDPEYKISAAPNMDEWDRWNNKRDRLLNIESPTLAKGTLAESTPVSENTPLPPSAPVRTSRRVPMPLTLPAGALMPVRINEEVSSDRSQGGDTFSATLQQPLVVDGWVVARRGQTIIGRVEVARKAKRIKGSSELGVELRELTLVDGQQVPLTTQLVQNSSRTSTASNAGTVAATTGVGTLIGAAAGGGTGAGIGAASGAAAGIIGILVTSGKPTVIPSESQLTFRQRVPIVISTERSQVAFRPVTQQDYDGAAGNLSVRSEEHLRRPYYPDPPYMYGGWGYPAPIFIGVRGGRDHRFSSDRDSRR